LKLFVFSVALPICPGNFRERKRSLVDFSSRFDVWSTAKVDKFSRFVNRDSFIASFVQVINQFLFQGLIKLFEFFHRLINRNLSFFKSNIFLDDRFHFFFKQWQIFRNQSPWKFEVVIKAIVYCWSDSELRFRKHFKNRSGKNVCG